MNGYNFTTILLNRNRRLICFFLPFSIISLSSFDTQSMSWKLLRFFFLGMGHLVAVWPSLLQQPHLGAAFTFVDFDLPECRVDNFPLLCLVLLRSCVCILAAFAIHCLDRLVLACISLFRAISFRISSYLHIPLPSFRPRWYCNLEEMLSLRAYRRHYSFHPQHAASLERHNAISSIHFQISVWL